MSCRLRLERNGHCRPETAGQNGTRPPRCRSRLSTAIGSSSQPLYPNSRRSKPLPGLRGAGGFARRGRFRGGGSRFRGHCRTAFTSRDFLMTALERRQAVAQRRIAAGDLEFVTNITMQPLQLGPLASQFGAFLRHGHFHLRHLLHQRCFILTKLLALGIQLCLEFEEFALLNRRFSSLGSVPRSHPRAALAAFGASRE